MTVVADAAGKPSVCGQHGPRLLRYGGGGLGPAVSAACSGWPGCQGAGQDRRRFQERCRRNGADPAVPAAGRLPRHV